MSPARLLITHHSSLITFLSHLPNYGQNHRPPAHFLSEVALEKSPHLLLDNFEVAQLVGVALTDQLHELCADVVEDVLAGVHMYQAARDDLGIANQLSPGIECHHDDDE